MRPAPLKALWGRSTEIGDEGRVGDWRQFPQTSNPQSRYLMFMERSMTAADDGVFYAEHCFALTNPL